MRKITTLFLSLGLAVALTAPALAGDLLSETFTYADGALTANAAWTAHSGAGVKVIMVSLGKVTVQQSAGSGEDVATPYAARSLTDKTYACFQLNVPTTGGFTGNTYFAHFKDATVSSFRTRTYIAPPQFGGNYTLAISNDGTGAQLLWGSDLTFGVDYTIVISYNAATGDAELWVNPANEASTKITDSDTPGAALAVSTFALRQATPTTGSVNQIIDNLGVGTTFDAACTSDPTPNRGSTWGQIKTLYR
jgi:hypothetical protein